MFSRDRADRDDRRSPRAYDGRGGRVEYLVWLAAIVVLLLLAHGAGRYGAIGLFGYGTARRLRDFGLSGWWVALLPIAGLGAGAAGRACDIPPVWLGLLAGLGLLAFVIAVAAMPGDPAPNRFGSPVRLASRSLLRREARLS